MNLPLADRVAAQLNQQVISAEVWLAQHRRYRDVSSARNAAFAAGKLAALADVALLMYEVPVELRAKIDALVDEGLSVTVDR